MARVRAAFPEISLEKAQEIAERGPTPDDLETAKQRVLLTIQNLVAGLPGDPELGAQGLFSLILID